MIFCGFAIMRWNRKIGVGFRHTHYISLVMLIPTYFGFYFEKCWKKYVCMDIYMDILNCLNVIDLHIWYLSLAAQAKKIYAAAVAEIPNSVRVWCAAANLEREKKSKRRVYQKALENIPNAVRLWKASVWNLGHLAPGRADSVRKFLYIAPLITCHPVTCRSPHNLPFFSGSEKTSYCDLIWFQDFFFEK